MNDVRTLQKRLAAIERKFKWVALVVGLILGEVLVALSVSGIEFWKLALASLVPLLLLWYAKGHL